MLTPRLRWTLLGVTLLLVGSFLYYVRGVLAPFVVALVLVYLLNPVVNLLTRLRVAGRPFPRAVAVVITLTVLLGGISLGIGTLIPALAREFKPFSASLSTHYEQLFHTLLPQWIQQIQQVVDQAGFEIDVHDVVFQSLPESFSPSSAGALLGNVQAILSGIVKTLFSSVLVFILTLFLLLDWPKIFASFRGLFPDRHWSSVQELISALDRDLSGSIRGQLSICLINFVLTTVGLTILEVNYALTLGFIAGTFSIVPVFGSIVSTIPVVLVTLTVSVWDAVKAVLMIIVIHLIEANLLNPKVMGHHVELHPVVILFAILVGQFIFGPVGLLIGVPLAAGLRSLLRFGVQRLVAVPEGPEPEPTPSEIVHPIENKTEV